jgi:hypothetical protein
MSRDESNARDGIEPWTWKPIPCPVTFAPAERKILDYDFRKRKQRRQRSDRQTAKDLDLSQPEVSKFRKTNKYVTGLYSGLICEKLESRLEAKNSTPTSKKPEREKTAFDYWQKIWQIIDADPENGGKFPVKSPLDGEEYADADAYADHLTAYAESRKKADPEEKNEVGFVREKSPPPRLDRNCWSEPTGREGTRYYRSVSAAAREMARLNPDAERWTQFEEEPRLVQLLEFYRDGAIEYVKVVSPGYVLPPTTHVKVVDDTVKECWPREYKAFKNGPPPPLARWDRGHLKPGGN